MAPFLTEHLRGLLLKILNGFNSQFVEKYFITLHLQLIKNLIRVSIPVRQQTIKIKASQSLKYTWEKKDRYKVSRNQWKMSHPANVVCGQDDLPFFSQAFNLKYRTSYMFFLLYLTASKVPVFGVFLASTFPHSGNSRIRTVSLTGERGWCS